MKRVLKLKNWQLFGLILIVPILLMAMGVILTKTTELNYFTSIFSFISALTMIISYYGWLWCVAVELNKQKIINRKFNLKTFKILFIIALVLFIFVIPILKTMLHEQNQMLLNILLLLSLTFFLCCLYFIAKSINIAEKQNNTKINSIVLDIFQLWLLPIGIWNIQPRIKQIIKEKQDKD